MRIALAVTVMGTILLRMTGIIGASVTMMTALALPTMTVIAMQICGVIAPPELLGFSYHCIMLVIMADLGYIGR